MTGADLTSAFLSTARFLLSPEKTARIDGLR